MKHLHHVQCTLWLEQRPWQGHSPSKLDKSDHYYVATYSITWFFPSCTYKINLTWYLILDSCLRVGSYAYFDGFPLKDSFTTLPMLKIEMLSWKLPSYLASIIIRKRERERERRARSYKEVSIIIFTTISLSNFDHQIRVAKISTA